MTSVSVDVLVPLAASGRGGGGAICELRASRNERPTEARGGLHPTIAPLVEVRLAAAGQRALDAVRRLPLPPTRKLARLRLTRPRPAHSQLTPLDVRQAQGLDPANAKSAELGLALALAALERGRAGRTFFATGTLDGPQALASGNDGPVGPVGGLAQKFAAIAAWLESHRVGPWGDSVLVFTPCRTEAGEPVREAHAAEIAELCARGQRAGVRVQVRPVASLAEAAATLGVVRPPADRREWTARAAVLTAAAASALLVSATLPLAVTPAPVALAGTAPAPSPVVLAHGLAAPGAPPVFVAQPTCHDRESLPVVPFGSRLAAEFATGKTLWPSRTLHLVYVAIGERSPPKVFSSRQVERLSAQNAVAPGDSTGPVAPLRKSDGRIRFGASIGIEAPAEEAKFVALVRKLVPYDAPGLVAALQTAADAAGEGGRLNAQAAWLASLPGSYAAVSYRAVPRATAAEIGCAGVAP